MFHKPRNWKWMVPAALIPVVFWWWNDWSMSEEPWKGLAVIPAGLGVVLLLAAGLNFMVYAWDHISDMTARVRVATNSTPEVRMFEAAKGMHPEAVKALLAHRRSIWRIKYVPTKDLVDWVFDEIPTVHAGFMDFVLDHSTSVSLMPKRMLSEGSKQFDPEELVTDYEQYDDLVRFLQAKLMVSQAYGNQAPQWLPPWNPETVRHRFGLDGAPYAVEEEDIPDVMKDVIREQTRWQGGKLKDLAAEERAAAKKPPVNGNGGKKNDDRELTDEELAAIERENEEYSKKLGLDI